MVASKKIYWVLLLILSSLWSSAQETYATVHLNRRSVFPGEPIKVTITVYTSTWFATSLDFATPAIENAMIIPFERTLSGVDQRKGKTFAMLQFFYQLYPLESGKYTLPSIPISFETPPEGDYKGKLRTVKTREQTYQLKKEVEKDGTPWFLAKKVTTSQRLSPNKMTYLQGDMVTRKTTLKAYGTLPLFIPETQWSIANGTSTYPKSPSFKDKRDDKQANGWRTQEVVYLLRDTGTVVLPEQEVSYFNPYRNRWISALFPAKEITVLPNPDLGILETIQDSLQTQTATVESAAPPTLSLKEAATGIGLAVGVFWIFSYLIKALMALTKRLLPSDQQIQNMKRTLWVIISRKDSKRIQIVYEDFDSRQNNSLSLRSHVKGTHLLPLWEKAQKDQKLSTWEALRILRWNRKTSYTSATKKVWSLNPN